MGYFSSTDRPGRGAVSSAFTHLLSIAFVAAALAITLGIREFSAVYPTFFAFYAAVAASAWYGGNGPGWVSVVLSTLAVNYFFLPPLVAFIICAIVANAVSARQKRVESALRLARQELEDTVLERTAELQSAN